MSRSITIAQIVSRYYSRIPGHKKEVSFVEYAGDATIYLYLFNGVKVIYDYKVDTIKSVDVNINYMEDLKNRFEIRTEKEYRSAFAYLLRGRMDALQISADDLAEKCNISRSTLFRILNKQVTPNGYTIHILEKNLQNSKNDIWRFL